MNVTHDLIAAVSGPGWKYGLSRILLNDEGEGVVFIAGQTEPLAAFMVDDVRQSRGRGTSEEGEITWRRRGSSCQYKLAKCKVSTEQMTQRWLDSLEPEPEPETVELPDEPEAEPEGDDTQEMEPVPTGAAHEILSWVGDDTDRARAALEAEQEGKQRVGLTADLEKMLAAEELL
jgi:hypothetical protein